MGTRAPLSGGLAWPEFLGRRLPPGLPVPRPINISALRSLLGAWRVKGLYECRDDFSNFEKEIPAALAATGLWESPHLSSVPVLSAAPQGGSCLMRSCTAGTKQQCSRTKPGAANFLGFSSGECQSHLFGK